MGIDVSVPHGSERADAPPHRSRYAAKCLWIILALEHVHPDRREYEHKRCKHKAEKKLFLAIGNHLREVAHRQREPAQSGKAKDSYQTEDAQQHKIGCARQEWQNERRQE